MNENSSNYKKKKNNNWDSQNKRLSNDTNQNYKKQYQNNNTQYKNRSKNKNDDFQFGNKEDDYAPKIYAKKEKHHNEIFDIPLPEYELEKQYQREKRAIDQKKKKNRKYRNYEEY